TTPQGQVLDLSRIPAPEDRRALLAYLVEFEAPYYAITNPRLGIGVGLRWPLEVFDKAWLWQEVHSGEDWPWFRRAYAVAIEPASTIPGQGIANARGKGSSLFLLPGRASREVVIEAVLFEDTRPVSGIAAGGAVTFAAPAPG
ncbi:MAG TPA: hypothetical protein VEJ84_02610, partial [Acidimicrobiales bacterium]|nr:hypothetical protein [Acidimicrobiales bacterium]